MSFSSMFMFSKFRSASMRHTLITAPLEKPLGRNSPPRTAPLWTPITIPLHKTPRNAHPPLRTRPKTPCSGTPPRGGATKHCVLKRLPPATPAATDVEAGGRPRPGAVVKMRSGRAAFVFDRPRLQCFAWPHDKDAKPACSSNRSISHSAARLRLTTLLGGSRTRIAIR